jgi:hypothetical protein
MMKCGIVKLSTIRKHDRLDAEFYLGGDFDERIKNARTQIKRWRTILRNIIAEKREAEARVQRMQENGEVR